jgi:hypothetical protein
VQSLRALHRAIQSANNARFGLEWTSRLPYRNLHPRFLAALEQYQDWPRPEQYDELAREVPQSAHEPEAELPRFVAQDRKVLEEVGGYEQHVAKLRQVPTRPNNWHDFFNMAVWAHFPRLRWALNALHVDDQIGPKDPRNGRAPAQNLAATLDESGVIVLSTNSSVLEDLRELRFKRVFWEHRAELLETTRFWFVGHGTLESLLTPHPGLTAKGLLLEVPRLPAPDAEDELRPAIDARAAAAVHGFRQRHHVLDPVPILGIPGYWDNERAEFYDDARHFRLERQSRANRSPTAPAP